jgi:hypothetical protein
MIPFTSTAKCILFIGSGILMIFGQQQYVNASSGSGFDCISIVGCYADGYELGKEAGAEDVREGRVHDSKCPPNDSLSFCTGYKTGYEVGWIAQRTLLD